HALGEAVLARTADVVHHLVRAALDDRPADPARNVVERFVPRDALPLARAAGPGPAKRVEDPVRVGDLVQRRRALRAVATAPARVLRVPLQLPDLAGFLAHVGEQARRRLGV